MKFIFFCICISSILFISCKVTKPDNQYNEALAKQLGADERGMKKYFFVILKTGSGILNDKDSVANIFRGHLDNINLLAKAGKLFIAGPLGKNEQNYRGFYFFDVATREEVQQLLQTDPAIQTKLLSPEIYDWYGSAALPVYLDTHKKIEKIKP